MTTLTVEELRVPASIDAPDAADFIASVAIRNAVDAVGYGTDELNVTAAEALPAWLDVENSPHRLFGVRLGGELVARAYYETNAAGDSRVAWSSVEVLPAHRGKGIGTALADHVEALVAGENCDRLLVYVVSPDGPGERIAPPTGFGSLPAGNPEVRFLTRRGYTLEQVERGSRLPLPLAASHLAGLVADAETRSGPDYRVQRWTGRIPERWLEDMAMLFTRMSTDAPSAGLEEPEDVWTAARAAEEDERQSASPRALLTVAVEHVPTGRLAGYSSLSVPPERHRAVIQEDTLVIREHRGHRLGMLLKVANLARLQEERPGHPSVITFNAEENRHMLSVNEAVGFTPIGYEGAWRKDMPRR